MLVWDWGNGTKSLESVLLAEPHVSSESKCHLRVVIFRRGPSARKKRNSIAHEGVPRGSSEKRRLFDLVLLCRGSLQQVSFSCGCEGKFQEDSPVHMKLLAPKGHFESDTETR